jgi:hypothetical protein
MGVAATADLVKTIGVDTIGQLVVAMGPSLAAGIVHKARSAHSACLSSRLPSLTPLIVAMNVPAVLLAAHYVALCGLRVLPYLQSCRGIYMPYHVYMCVCCAYWAASLPFPAHLLSILPQMGSELTAELVERIGPAVAAGIVRSASGQVTGALVRMLGAQSVAQLVMRLGVLLNLELVSSLGPILLARLVAGAL